MTMTYSPASVVDQGDLPATFNSALGLAWDGQQLVVPTSAGDRPLGVLTRNNDGTYTPSNLTSAGNFSSLPFEISPNSATWDGIQLVFVGIGHIATLARNANGTYTPANGFGYGQALPAGLGGTTGNGVTWDGTQLVIIDFTTRSLATLARNNDNTYTPGNAVLQGTLPAAVSGPSSLTWDGTQLITCGHTDRELFTLARDSDGGYTPNNAVSSGAFSSSVGGPRALTWDGDRLVILADD